MTSVLRDPLIVGGALFAALLHAWMLFVGEYVPYYDWPNHLGLIAVLAHGDQTGALAYFDRSLAPTPYLLFYVFSAALAQVVDVASAAKLAFCAASAGTVLAGAWLAQTGGRDPRLALLAPLSLFGYALGYGFASFLFATPFVLASWAAVEELLNAHRDGRAQRRHAAHVAVWLALCYLAHALMILTVGLTVLVRVLVHCLGQRRRGSGALTPLAWMSAALTPTATLVVWTLAVVYGRGIQETETTSGGTSPALTWVPATDRLAAWSTFLIDRGDPGYRPIMLALLGLLGVAVAASLVPRWRLRPRSAGLELYALGVLVLFVFGPESINWPFSVWLYGSRLAPLGALAVFLVVPVDLRRWRGAVYGACVGTALFANARIQRAQIADLNQKAAPYARVRDLVPFGARVLEVTAGLPSGDVALAHPSLQTLYFYHLVDGAAYTAYLFDNPFVPVVHEHDVRPSFPDWRRKHTFSADAHGRDFDYVVVRGSSLVTRMKNSDAHVFVENVSGWFVFRTIDPPAWPSGFQAPASPSSS